MPQPVIQTEKLNQAIEAYVRGKTPKEVSEELGISLSSAYKYLKHPKCKKALESLRSSLEREVVNLYLRASRKAIYTLERACESEDQRVAVSAAKCIVDRLSVFIGKAEVQTQATDGVVSLGDLKMLDALKGK